MPDGLRALEDPIDAGNLVRERLELSGAAAAVSSNPTQASDLHSRDRRVFESFIDDRTARQASVGTRLAGVAPSGHGDCESYRCG